MDGAIKALTANGLTKMNGVRGESYVYRSDGKLTFFDLKGTQFYAQGEISHLSAVLGYSEDEIGRAVYEVSGDSWVTCEVMKLLAKYRNEE